MAKVLVITKPDKTTHVVSLQNKAFYQGQNNRMPVEKRWKLEEMDEAEAGKLPFINKDHVTASDAVSRSQALAAENDALRKQLADLQAAQGAGAGASSGKPEKTAKEVIELIEACTEAAQVEALSAGDERATVKAAAEKKIKSFTE